MTGLSTLSGPLKNLVKALHNPSRIRNVCVIAHVDHGKTSLCDHLVAHNGWLNPRSAGHERYLDSREDEQSRLITIKSSAMPLLYHVPGSEAFVVNLIDSPGHADLSVEVSAAARLSDGALLVVDVVEGFLSQSRMVLKQAWTEGLEVVLVLNKMDRLFAELKMTAGEVYTHLLQVIEQVNVGLHQCIAEEWGHVDDPDQVDAIFNQKCFAPERNNVVFASAQDSWAFRLDFFARLLATKLLALKDKAGRPPRSEAETQGQSPSTSESAVYVEEMTKKLMGKFWGSWYLDVKTLSITSKASTRAPNNIAITYAFDYLENLYQAQTNCDLEALTKIYRATVGKGVRAPQQSGHQTSGEVSVRPDLSLEDFLNAASSCRDSANAQGIETAARKLLSRWLPCAPAILEAVVSVFPDPLAALPRRLSFISPRSKCQTWGPGPTTPTVFYSAKSLHADLELLRLTADKLRGTEKVTDFVAFGRVFSGEISPGQRLEILAPARASIPVPSPSSPCLPAAVAVAEGVEEVTTEGAAVAKMETEVERDFIYVKNVYLPIGLDLESLPHAPCGSVVALSLSSCPPSNYETAAAPTEPLAPGEPPAGPHSPRQKEGGNLIQAEKENSLFEESIQSTVRWLLSLRDRRAVMRDRDRQVRLAEGGAGTGLSETGRQRGFNAVDRGITLAARSVSHGVSHSVSEGVADGVSAFESVYKSQARGILRVAVGPERLPDWQDFMRGLALLYRADPAVSIEFLPSGELIACCQGQVHLDRVVQDLNELYCSHVPITVTPPLLSLRETILWPAPDAQLLISRAARTRPYPPWCSEEPSSVIAAVTEGGGGGGGREIGDLRNLGWARNGDICLKVRAVPMPSTLLRWIEQNKDFLETVPDDFWEAASGRELRARLAKEVSNEVRKEKKRGAGEEGGEEGDGEEGADGGDGEGRESTAASMEVARMLEKYELTFICVDGDSRTALFLPSATAAEQKIGDFLNYSGADTSYATLRSACIAGLRLCSPAGPLCEEPIYAVAFILEGVSVDDPVDDPVDEVDRVDRAETRAETGPPAASAPTSVDGEMVDLEENRSANGDGGSLDILSVPSGRSVTGRSVTGRSMTTNTSRNMTGSLIGLFKMACRNALTARGQNRVVELMLKVTIHCAESVLGKVHDLLAQKRFVVSSQELDERTFEFVLVGSIPANEMLTILADFRKKSSGKAAWSYEVLDWVTNSQDPFPEASTTEDYELDEGADAKAVNAARRLVTDIRTRKGLPTGAKLVLAANKQRTLGRGK